MFLCPEFYLSRVWKLSVVKNSVKLRVKLNPGEENLVGMDFLECKGPLLVGTVLGAFYMVILLSHITI